MSNEFPVPSVAFICRRNCGRRTQVCTTFQLVFPVSRETNSFILNIHIFILSFVEFILETNYRSRRFIRLRRIIRLQYKFGQ